MKRKWFILFAIICFSTLITSCNNTKTINVLPAEKITMFMTDRDEAPISDELEIIKALEEKCKINLELEVYSNIEAPEKFKTYIKSGIMPDIVVYKLDEIYKNTSLFTPINTLIGDKTPNLKKILLEDDFVRNELTAVDGNMYAFPMIAAEKVSQVYFARMDWLNKLKIDKPKTLDDFYHMLIAIRDGDPNENHQKDEIPFVTRFRKNGLMQFLEPFGIREEFFIENGKFHYGAADPRMKDALTFINKLYQEELIDTNYIASDAKMWESNVVNHKSGVLFDWLSRIDYFNKAVPDASFEAFLPPSLDGKSPTTHYQMSKIRGNSAAAAINKNSKHIDKIIKMYEFIFSDEGILLTNFGIENKHYRLENHEPVYLETIMAAPDGKTPQIALWSYGIAMDWPMKQDPRYEKQFLSSTANKAREMYNPIILPDIPRLKFTGEEIAELDVLLGDIRAYKDEWIDRFIIGTNSLSEFDAFVEHLKQLGLDRVLEIYNAAYARYMD